MPSKVAPFELRWGMLSTGYIAAFFAKDSLVSPATRDVHDVSHRVVAVASRSLGSANKFISEYFKEGGPIPKAYDDIDAFLADPEIDAVYIASPNTMHFSQTKKCIEAGKGVLLEKPAVVNAAQAKYLFDLAKKHNVFLMEAVWTHFLPIANDVREIIDKGLLGEIRHVNSTFSLDVGPNTIPDADRFISPAAGGGSLLDLGPYAWTWLQLTVGRSRTSLNPPAGPLPLPKINAHATLLSLDDTSRPAFHKVDETILATMVFPALSPTTSPATATFHTSIVTLPPQGGPCCVVLGSRGKLLIDFPASAPTRLTLETHDVMKNPVAVPLLKKDVKIEVRNYVNGPGGARGFVWEMDEVARCIRDGKLESDVVPARATIQTMELFDEIRRQNNLVYSPELEALE
ncbi:NAD(P)-binding protein [Meredithblackwellia eburnea MCA 4105]